MFSRKFKLQNNTYKKFLKIKDITIFFDSFLNIFFYYWLNYINTKNYIFEIFSNSLLFLNQHIKINAKNKNLHGIFKGINNDGSLILYENKELINIYSGSIEI